VTDECSAFSFWFRFELLTLELDVEADTCVYDRLTIMGGKEMSGSMCGDRSSEVTIMEVEDGKDITIALQVQSEVWRWNIGITQVRRTDIFYCTALEI
jgi:hypothetical protein